jgi:hypothetical protein
VPIRDAAGELHSLQFIGASGTKRFLKGGRVVGLYFLIGVAGKVICIAEGYATGASIHAATPSDSNPVRNTTLRSDSNPIGKGLVVTNCHQCGKVPA